MKSLLLWIWIALLSLAGTLLSPSVQTSVTLTSFTAEAGTNSITLKWETASETNNLGFFLWRGLDATGPYSKIPGFIPSLDEGAGALYEYVDNNVTPGVTHYYKLQAVPDDGSTGEFAGPISATIPPTVTLTPTQTPTPWPTSISCIAGTRLRSTSFTAPIVANLSHAPNAAEVEPNNDYATANVFVIPGNMTGAINPFGDEDYFRISTGSGQVYVINITRESTQERRIDVYTNAYVWVAGAQTDPANPTVSLYFSAQTTLYYIRVSAPNNDFTAGPIDYTIVVEQLSTPMPTPTPTNTTTPTPTPTPTNTTTPTPTPTPTNTTTPTPTPTNIITSTATPTITPWPTATPVPPPLNTPVEVEPNDTIGTANLLAVPGKVVGAVTSIYDVDCFAINIANTLIGAQYRFILKDYGLTRWLKVYDNNGYYIMGDSTATNHEAELTLQAALPRYYLCVSSVTTASPANTIVDYLLEVTVLHPTPPPVKIYLPLVLRGWPLPPPPIPVGATVRFKGAWYDMPLEGVVTCSENCGVLYNYSTPYYPQGIFVVVLMDVTNHGLRSDEVGQHNSFKVQDAVGRVFDLASLKVHQAAESTYQRESLYYPIQPGFTVPLVFVFDVLPQSEGLRLVAVEPW